MYRLIPLFLVLIICSSCQVYQYSVFHAEHETSLDAPFTFENDSLTLNYSFAKGTAQVEIYNKTNKPLYIDWTKSALIANGISEPYWDGRSSVNLSTSQYNSVINPGFSNGYATGTIDSKMAISIVPPDSKLINSSLDISHLLPKKKGKMESKVYTEQSSPLKLRSYLAISYDQALSSPVFLDHSFWLSETYQYGAKPVVTPKPNAYLSSTTVKAGAFTAGVVGFGLIIWAAASTSDIHNKPQQ